MDTIDGNYLQMQQIDNEENLSVFEEFDNNDYSNLKRNIRIKDSAGNTILHRLINNAKDEDDAIDKYFVLNKQIPNISVLFNDVNNEMETVLHIICKKGYFKLFIMIIGKRYHYEKDIDETFDIKSVKIDKEKNKTLFNYYAKDKNDNIPLIYLLQGKEINFKNIGVIDAIKSLVNNEMISYDCKYENPFEKIYTVLIDNSLQLRVINKPFIDAYMRKCDEIVNRYIVNKIYKLTVKDYYDKFITEKKASNYNKAICKYVLHKLNNSLTDKIDNNEITMNKINLIINDNIYNQQMMKCLIDNKEIDLPDNLLIVFNDEGFKNYFKYLINLPSTSNVNLLHNIFNYIIKIITINDINTNDSLIFFFNLFYSIVKLEYKYTDDKTPYDDDKVLKFIVENENKNPINSILAVKLILEDDKYYEVLNKSINDLDEEIDLINNETIKDIIKRSQIMNRLFGTNFLNGLLSFYPSIKFCIENKILDIKSKDELSKMKYLDICEDPTNVGMDPSLLKTRINGYDVGYLFYVRDTLILEKIIPLFEKLTDKQAQYLFNFKTIKKINKNKKIVLRHLTNYYNYFFRFLYLDVNLNGTKNFLKIVHTILNLELEKNLLTHQLNLDTNCNTNYKAKLKDLLQDITELKELEYYDVIGKINKTCYEKISDGDRTIIKDMFEKEYVYDLYKDILSKNNNVLNDYDGVDINIVINNDTCKEIVVYVDKVRRNIRFRAPRSPDEITYMNYFNSKTINTVLTVNPYEIVNPLTLSNEIKQSLINGINNIFVFNLPFYIYDINNRNNEFIKYAKFLTDDDINVSFKKFIKDKDLTIKLDKDNYEKKDNTKKQLDLINSNVKNIYNTNIYKINNIILKGL